MACKRNNFITPWLGAFIFLPHMDYPNLKVKFDIQWPCPNFNVAETKMACKRYNFKTSWLRTFISLIWRWRSTFSDLDPILGSREPKWLVTVITMCINLYFSMLMDRAYGWGVLPSIDGYFYICRTILVVVCQCRIGHNTTHYNTHDT